MSQVLEAMMVLSFGAAWPTSIVKSYRARTAKGKSLPFLLIVFFGYLCGIASKLVQGNRTYVLAFYVLNALMVLIDIAVYLRNRHLDASSHA